jgi:glycosyltransferase involved in cell wall biosynthesis
MLNPKKIIFLTIGEAGYSRSWTYFNGAKKLGANVEFIKIDSSKLIKQFLQIKKQLSKDSIFVVMSPSQYLVPFVRFFLGKNIVLDAGLSLFEGTVISRKRYGFLGSLAIKNYLIDFISSHIAKKIILESKLQKEFYLKLFLVKRKKCFVLYSGVDEEAFIENKSYELPPDIFSNSKIVLFRGKYTAEAGVEILAEATKLLSSESITFWVFCPGLPPIIKFSSNTITITTVVETKHDLARVYNASALTIGQLSNHKRLKRTIPHKAYESAFLSNPYLSSSNLGINELFIENKEILCINANNALELALKIKDVINNPVALKSTGVKMNEKYNSICSQSLLSATFLEIISMNGNE